MHLNSISNKFGGENIDKKDSIQIPEIKTLEIQEGFKCVKIKEFCTWQKANISDGINFGDQKDESQIASTYDIDLQNNNDTEGMDIWKYIYSQMPPTENKIHDENNIKTLLIPGQSKVRRQP